MAPTVLGSRRRTRALTGVAALLACAAVPHAGAAAVITVDGTGSVAAADGVCVLVEAVVNANADNQSGSPDCPAGSGADIIRFARSGEYPTAGVPAVAATGPLEISGEGHRVVLRGGPTHRVLAVAEGADATLRRLELRGGVAMDCPGISVYVGCGGGVFNAGRLTLVESLVADNDAGADGFGGGVMNRGTATIVRSTVAGNRAGAGSALGDVGALTLTDSTVAGNVAGDRGGAVYSAGATRLQGATLTGNTAAAPAAPAALLTDPGAAVTLANTVISGSPGTLTCAGPGIGATGGVVSFPEGGCPGTPVDPMLGALGDNGGPTPTAVPLPGSPLIDAGVAAECSAVDQRGVARPQGPACDIGAVEVAVDVEVPDPSGPVVDAVVDGPAGLDGWYVGDVTVRWSVADPESAVTSTQGCDATVVTEDSTGLTLTCVAESAGGTTSRAVVVRRDTSAPLVGVKNPAKGARYRVGQHVRADYACTDRVSGVVSCEGTTPSGAPLDTSTPGPRRWRLVARDAAGNTTEVNADHTVGFAYSGLIGWVKGVPQVNHVLAGTTVPLRFTLGGDVGGDVLDDAQRVASSRRSCTDGRRIKDTLDRREVRVRYDAKSGSYTVAWPTARSWAGTCRDLVLNFADGTDQVAMFAFRKRSGR